MGSKKKKKVFRPWCWYCNRDFDDEKVLIQHQKSKHYKCHVCNKKLNTAGGLVVHCQQVHKESLRKVPNAMSGRDNVEIEIFGMEGVPEHDMTAHLAALDGQQLSKRVKTDSGDITPPSITGSVTPPVLDQSTSASLASYHNFPSMSMTQQQLSQPSALPPSHANMSAPPPYPAFPGSSPMFSFPGFPPFLQMPNMPNFPSVGTISPQFQSMPPGFPGFMSPPSMQHNFPPGVPPLMPGMSFNPHLGFPPPGFPPIPSTFNPSTLVAMPPSTIQQSIPSQMTLTHPSTTPPMTLPIPENNLTSGHDFNQLQSTYDSNRNESSTLHHQGGMVTSNDGNNLTAQPPLPQHSLSETGKPQVILYTDDVYTMEEHRAMLEQYRHFHRPSQPVTENNVNNDTKAKTDGDDDDDDLHVAVKRYHIDLFA